MKTTTTRTFAPCWDCGGSGVRYNESLTVPNVTCGRCDGTGQIIVSETITVEDVEERPALNVVDVRPKEPTRG